jgi:hypothetical protein
MHHTGLAPEGDDLGVRWVAVRHAADHIHIVATLARQDGTRPKVWNDFYRVREACQEAEVARRWPRCAPTADCERLAVAGVRICGWRQEHRHTALDNAAPTRQ